MVVGESNQIPFVSQHNASLPIDWQSRACGLASLLMVLSYWQNQNKNVQPPALPELLEAGLEHRAYLLGIGWLHKGLVDLARTFGGTGWNKDLTFAAPDLAWQEFLTDLEHYPLIVSVYKNFSRAEFGSSHLLVVGGVEGENVFLLDPKEVSEKDGRTSLPIEKFRTGWTQRYIAIFPKD